MSVQDLPGRWRAWAEGLALYSPPAARAFEQAAHELEREIREHGHAPLSIPEAAAASGYSERRLRELVEKGELENIGRAGRIRVRRADVPRRAGKVPSHVDQIAAEIVRDLGF